MSKVVLVLLVFAVAVIWWSLGRRDRRGGDSAAKDGGAGAGSAKSGPGRPGAAPTMIACSHCGVHLPQPEALFDAAGRAFCSEAHRLAGPR